MALAGSRSSAGRFRQPGQAPRGRSHQAFRAHVTVGLAVRSAPRAALPRRPTRDARAPYARVGAMSLARWSRGAAQASTSVFRRTGLDQAGVTRTALDRLTPWSQHGRSRDGRSAGGGPPRPGWQDRQRTGGDRHARDDRSRAARATPDRPRIVTHSRGGNGAERWGLVRIGDVNGGPKGHNLRVRARRPAPRLRGSP